MVKGGALPGAGKTLPFWPSLINTGTTEAPTYAVTVTRGVVVDRVTTDADAVVYYEPVVLTTGEPTQFAITDTQCVCVKVATLDTGAIDGVPEIVVVNSDKESIHYIPPVGNETTGTAGEYYYKLASFAVGPPAVLTMFAAGDNIEHYRELPMFVKAGGTADVFKEFLASAGKYKTRGISAGDGITVTENASDIQIKLDPAMGIWGTFTLRFNDDVNSTYSELSLTFENGILTATGYAGDTIHTGAGTEASPIGALITCADTDT